MSRDSSLRFFFRLMNEDHIEVAFLDSQTNEVMTLTFEVNTLHNFASQSMKLVQFSDLINERED